MKNFYLKTAVLTALFGFEFLMAQSLGLDRAGKMFSSELESSFPYFAGGGLILVGLYALYDYGKTKDYMESLKIVLFYIVGVLVVVGGYQFVKSQSL